MSKGSGSSRQKMPTQSSNMYQAVPKSVDEIKGLSAEATQKALKGTEETVKAIVNGGGMAGNGWAVYDALVNRNTAFEVFGKDANDPNLTAVVDKLNITRASASSLMEGDVVSDGSSVYTVQKVNKDGSVRAAYTSYHKVSSSAFSTGYSFKPYAETIKFGKNDTVIRFGNGQAAIDYQGKYEAHSKKVKYNLK